jgi:putative nucleotidyltransferase with HDIG domain
VALPDRLRERIEDRLAQGQVELPMLPEVAARILAGDLDDLATLGGLGATIERDPALAAHVLRLANSAAYLGGARLQSIQQALVRIGTTQLRELVVAAALQSGVFRAGACAELVGALWAHSAATAAYAREVARALRTNVEIAFLAGLLHDVGKPVVLSLLLDVSRATPDRPPAAVCVDALAVYHTRVGRDLAERWGLPGHVVACVASHHAFETAERDPQAVAVTCLADLLAHVALADEPSAAGREALVRAHPVCVALNLYPDDLDGLLARRAAVRAFAEGFGR